MITITRHTDSVAHWLAIALLAFVFGCGGAVAQTPQDPLANTTEEGAPSEPNSTTQQPLTRQPLFPKVLAAAVRKQSAEIERLAKSIERVRENDNQLKLLRPEVTAITDAAAATEAKLKPLLAVVEQQIAELGAKPKENEPAETAAIASVRTRLDRARRDLFGASQRARLTRLSSRQLIARIQSLHLENLGRDLRKRHANPISGAYRQKFWEDLPRFSRQVSTVAENWWAVARDRIHWLILILLGAWFFWWIIHTAGKARVARALSEPPGSGPPVYLDRVNMALRTFPFLFAPGLVTTGVIYFGLWASGLFNEQIDGLALSALKSVTLFLITNALAKTILLPWKPSWRLIGLPTVTARRYLWLTRLLAGVYCIDIWLEDALAQLHVPLSIGIAENLIANLAFAVLLFAFAWMPTYADPAMQEERRTEDAPERASARLMRQAVYWLRVPATLAVIVIVVATLLGYLALGRFVAGQVMLVGIGAAAILLGHLAARALANRPEKVSSRLEGVLSDKLALSDRRRRQAFGFASVMLNVGLAIAAIFMLLLSWGYSDAELIGWGRSLLFGFEIGKFKFSLLQIVLAIALFVGVVLLTRLFQTWLSKKILSGERVDRGIANSIHAGVGYAGMALAALIGISYAGLDLSNIALIASALSIGIGFGLNAIASNFVSGLIMLIERPIKVGDWVVVGEHQGYVRHISVRATEIETFDRASVIIPNSDFMTGAVQNWTHRNAMGRVVVTVGASYQANPNEVMEVLRQVATDCDALLKYPAPSVQFDEFGSSSLDFSIRGFIADVNSMLSAKTALRLEIAEAFQKAGIEIPFPQQDVHLRDLDGVRELVGQAMTKRAEARENHAMPFGKDNDEEAPTKT